MWIYKITNDINNKVYIGQSSRNVKERFTCHLNDAMSNRLDTHFVEQLENMVLNIFTIKS